MTNVKFLADNSAQESNIQAAEADHDPVKVTITLSPLTQFIVDAALNARTRSSAVRALLDSAALDLLEAKGYKLDSPEFREKYYTWLTRKPLEPFYDPETKEVVEDAKETVRL